MKLIRLPAVSCTISQADSLNYMTNSKPKLHMFRVRVAKNIYYSVYVEPENAEQAESALECAAMSKVDTDAITEEMEDEVYNVEKVPESECLLNAQTSATRTS
jgi:hypothetical protein